MIPGTLPTGTYRRVPAVSKNKRVPLWTVEPEGQRFQGIIRVPVRLCNTPAHTNARHEFDNLIRANLGRWVAWRAARGWFLTNPPHVSGPYDPPEQERAKERMERATKVIGKPREVGVVTDFDHAEEIKWYVAEARFAREDPVYVRLEDMITLRHMALQYGVDPDRDPKPMTDLPEAKDEIVVEGGLDPMVVAEERRQSLGLKREDYLIGKLSDPL